MDNIYIVFYEQDPFVKKRSFIPAIIINTEGAITMQ